MEKLYSRIIRAGERTYFVDVLEARNKSRHLTLTETGPSGTGTRKYYRSRVLVFAELVDELRDAIVEAAALFPSVRSSKLDKGAAALDVLARLRAALPAMDKRNAPQPGTDAVDVLAELWPEVQELTSRPKKGGRR